MQKIPEDVFLLDKKAKYCPSCGKHEVRRNNEKCRHCGHSHDEKLDLERCHNCLHILAPKWSFCELCGAETRRAARLKRAKALSSRAKFQKVASGCAGVSSSAGTSRSARLSSVDIFDELDIDTDELDSLESASMSTTPVTMPPVSPT